MKQIKKVLIVDDSKLARLTLSRLLKAKDINVLESDSVDHALSLLDKERVNAVFWDVQMPEKSGFEGLVTMKENDRLSDIPCSMYSGDLSTETQQEAVSRGAQAYLFKPANKDSLEEVLTALSHNVIASNMQKYVSEGQTHANHQANRQIKTHKKALLTLDTRTRSLAKLFSQEKKESSKNIKQLNSHLSNLDKDIETLDQTQKHSLAKTRESCDSYQQVIIEIQKQLKLAIGLSALAIFSALIAIIIAL